MSLPDYDCDGHGHLKEGCRRPCGCDEYGGCDVLADAARLEERARIVALLRAKAAASLWSVSNSLRSVADMIERGE